MRNHYQTLQVHPNTDQDTIKSAYRTLMFKQRCHPDLGGNEENARLINEAYETLKSPKKRKAYDLTLAPEVFELNRTDFGTVERRRVPRVDVNLNISYKKAGTDKILTGRIMDLSSLGCKLHTEHLVRDGTKLTIRIARQTVTGKVKWKRMFHPSIFQRVYESGIQFTKEFQGIEKLRKIAD